MTEILDNFLYLGSVYDVEPTFLKCRRIKCIINVAEEYTYTMQEIPDLNYPQI